ncbi:MAG: hypothetical protein M3P46_05980 [Actinomycetota bacterium]|nr:hypothetical protein [Actinomycetota bacterium]
MTTTVTSTPAGPAICPPGARRTRRPSAVAGLGLLSAALAAGVHVAVFADGSANNDEVAYLLQAQSLADGQLFPDVPPEGRAAQPWFFVARNGEFVPKYLPLVPALPPSACG